MRAARFRACSERIKHGGQPEGSNCATIGQHGGRAVAVAAEQCKVAAVAAGKGLEASSMLFGEVRLGHSVEPFWIARGPVGMPVASP